MASTRPRFPSWIPRSVLVSRIAPSGFGSMAPQDQLGAEVAAAPLVVDPQVEPPGEISPRVAQQLQHGQHDGLVELVLAHPLAERARLVVAVVAAVPDPAGVRVLHQVVVLGHGVDQQQQRAATGPAPDPGHQVVAAGVDQVVGADGVQLRPKHLLDVADQLRIVRLHQRGRAERDVRRHGHQLEQRLGQVALVDGRAGSGARVDGGGVGADRRVSHDALPGRSGGHDTARASARRVSSGACWQTRPTVLKTSSSSNGLAMAAAAASASACARASRAPERTITGSSAVAGRKLTLRGPERAAVHHRHHQVEDDDVR